MIISYENRSMQAEPGMGVMQCLRELQVDMRGVLAVQQQGRVLELTDAVMQAGEIRLLTLVDETKSVRAACQRMQISYSTGWNIIRTLESQLCYPLILRTQGGAKGSTSTLTDRGKVLLERFNSYQQALRNHASALYEQYFGELFL